VDRLLTNYVQTDIDRSDALHPFYEVPQERVAIDLTLDSIGFG
jgi:hypothetical protein